MKRVLFTSQFSSEMHRLHLYPRFGGLRRTLLYQDFSSLSYSTKSKIKHYKSNLFQKHHLGTSIKISQVFSPRNVDLYLEMYILVHFIFINYFRYFLYTLTGYFENSFVGWIAALTANVNFVEFLVLICGQKHSFSSFVSHLTGTASTQLIYWVRLFVIVWVRSRLTDDFIFSHLLM